MRWLITIIGWCWILTSCLPFGQTKVSVEIPDVSENWVKRIEVRIPEKKYVYKIKVNLNGELNEISKVNGKIIGPGRIDKILDAGDYYGTDYLIKYESLGSNVGSLNIELIFYYN